MKTYMREIVNYIEKHHKEKINLTEIANYIGFSRFYLNHIFKIYTGMSIMSYVKKTRLELALDELKSDKRILDIAIEYGYASERSFSKAVKDEYGHSPSYFRDTDVLKMRKLKIYDLNLEIDEEKFHNKFSDMSSDIQQSIKNKGVLQIMNYLSDVSYITIKEMVVLSATKYGREPEEAVINFMTQLIDEYGLAPVRQFGFDSPVESQENEQDYRGYEFWLVLSNEDQKKWLELKIDTYKNEKMLLKTIPSYRYAKLRIDNPFKNPFERIPAGWKALVTWLEKHDFKENDFKFCGCANCLEEVVEINGNTVMDIFIPIDRA